MSDGTVQRYWVRGIQMWHEPQSDDNAEVVLASDYAALRAKVETLEQDKRDMQYLISELRAQLAAIQETVGDTEFSLRQQLAAMTQERDRLQAFVEWALSEDAGIFRFSDS